MPTYDADVIRPGNPKTRVPEAPEAHIELNSEQIKELSALIVKFLPIGQLVSEARRWAPREEVDEILAEAPAVFGDISS